MLFLARVRLGAFGCLSPTWPGKEPVPAQVPSPHRASLCPGSALGLQSWVLIRPAVLSLLPLQSHTGMLLPQHLAPCLLPFQTMGGDFPTEAPPTFCERVLQCPSGCSKSTCCTTPLPPPPPPHPPSSWDRGHISLHLTYAPAFVAPGQNLGSAETRS